MIGTFALVTLQSFVNRIVSRLKRLRNPRYLLGAIAGAAYFYFIVFRRMGRRGGGSAAAVTFAQLGLNGVFVDIAAAAVLGLAILVWAFPGDEGGIELTEAEIAFLFPAPLRRRDILLYKVIRSQPQIFLTSLVALFFSRGWFVGTWAVFTVAQLYATMTSFGRARLRLLRIGFFTRLAAVFGILSLLAWYGWSHLRPALHAARAGGTRSLPSIHETLSHRLANALLFVPRFFVRAMYPSDFATFGISVGVLAVLGFLLFSIAVPLNVSFS